jgi:hypothetical protein
MDATVASTTGRAAGDPAVPPGWRANPSAWAERLPIAGVAVVGFAIAAYLTLFQLGVLDRVWEPFFGDGSRTVLTSGVSRLLPVPDAALGAAGYLLDAVAGLVGGPGGGGPCPGS